MDPMENLVRAMISWFLEIASIPLVGLALAAVFLVVAAYYYVRVRLRGR